jgi:hypothetical protein
MHTHAYSTCKEHKRNQVGVDVPYPVIKLQTLARQFCLCLWVDLITLEKMPYIKYLYTYMHLCWNVGRAKSFEHRVLSPPFLPYLFMTMTGSSKVSVSILRYGMETGNYLMHLFLEFSEDPLAGLVLRISYIMYILYHYIYLSSDQEMSIQHGRRYVLCTYVCT